MRRWVSPALLVCLAGCGGKAASYESFQGSIGATAATSVGGSSSGGSTSGGSTTGGSTSGGASLGGSTSGGSTTGGLTSGGASLGGSTSGGASPGGSTAEAGGAGLFGGAGVSGGAGAGSSACATPRDCPLPPNACVVPQCVAGACNTENVSAGSVSILDTPADCHSTVACDGNGGAVRVVDQKNPPTPPNPCLVGTCNSAGTPGVEPLPPRTRCPAPRFGLCDGAGNCTECLVSADCPLGLSCATTHSCVNAPCTDVDCGGVCPKCAVGKKCLVDNDCASGACDAISFTCVTDHCQDHQQDDQETDLDCGVFCPGCALGKRCQEPRDCSSSACDGTSHVCVPDQCNDDASDGAETDTDCGGVDSCPRCLTGKYCRVNEDCVAGHSCFQSMCN